MGIISQISKLWASRATGADTSSDTSETGDRGGPGARGLGAGTSSPLDKFFENLQGSSGRQQLYNTYDEIEEGTPEIASILDIYADYATSGGTHDGTNSLRLTSKNKTFDRRLRNIDRSIKISSKAWRIVRCMVQYGDAFYETVSTPVGVQDMKVLPRREMFRIQDEKGRLRGFQQRAPNSPDPINFEPWQVSHFRLQYDDESAYGRSVLWPVKREALELILMRSGLTITRLSRAHQRLVHKVEVGDATSGTEIEKILAAAQERNYRVKTIDPRTGRMNLRANPLRTEGDIWIPTSKGSNADVEVLQGDKSVESIEDVLFKRSGILTGAKIPESWLGLTGPNVRNVADHQVINFLKTVRRIQRDFVAAAIVPYQIALMLQGIPWSRVFLGEIDIAFPKMSLVEDRLRLEIDKIRAELSASLIASRLYSRHEILVSVFELSDEDAARILDDADSDPVVVGIVPATGANTQERYTQVLSASERDRVLNEVSDLALSSGVVGESLDNLVFLVEEIRKSAEFRGLL